MRHAHLPAVAVLWWLVGVSPAAAQARTFAVTVTADTPDAVPGDGACADAAGACSLRAAVEEANTTTAAGGDRIVLPAGRYVLTLGALTVTASVTVAGAGSGVTIVDGNGTTNVLLLGTVPFVQRLFQGTNASTGAPIPRAVATASSVDELGVPSPRPNCLAAEGCIAKPNLTDQGGFNALPSVAFDFTLSAADRAAVAVPGIALVRVQAARDIGREPGKPPDDVLTATLDGQPTGGVSLFGQTLDTCPPGELDASGAPRPVDLECGPNFHTDATAVDRFFLLGPAFQAAAADGTLRLVLSPSAAIGRLKIFSVELSYLKTVSVSVSGVTIQGSPNSAIVNRGADLSGTDVVVRDNTAPVGAALSNFFGSVSLRGCTFTRNTAFAGGAIFNSGDAFVVLDGCSLTDNLATVVDGGAILNRGSLLLMDSAVDGNVANVAGAISNGGGGSAVLQRCTVNGNLASTGPGGGILNVGADLTLQDTTVGRNTAGTGGGISSNGEARLERSTVSENLASVGDGGGILNRGSLLLTNTTISGNRAKLGGGGIQNASLLSVSFSTIALNSANFDLSGNFNPAAVGGGIHDLPTGTVTMGNSILARNFDGRDTGLPAPPGLVSPDCFSIPSPALPAAFVSQRDNVVGVLTASCNLTDRDPAVTGTPFDRIGTPAAPLDPAILPLADNGGFTFTHALEPGSPAIDADVDVSPSPTYRCPATDQRSFRRPGDNPGDTVCDAGAYEAGARTAVPFIAGTRRVLVRFRDILQPGVTRAEIRPTGPNPPAGFMAGAPPLFLDVSTTAAFEPRATVCLDITGIAFQHPGTVRLFHLEDRTGDGVPETWVDRTVAFARDRNVVCARVRSLGLFAAFERKDEERGCEDHEDHRADR